MDLETIEATAIQGNCRMLFYPTANKFVVADGAHYYIVSRVSIAIKLLEYLPVRTVRENQFGGKVRSEFLGQAFR